MKYSIARILHNLVHNGLLYLFILISFMLGSGLFIICMNFRMTGEQLLEEVKRQSVEEPVAVFGGGRDLDRTVYPISYEDYLDLSSNPQYAEELDILFALKTYVIVFMLEADDGAEFDMYFMNDALFDYLYGFERSEGMAYLGDTAYEQLLRVGNTVKSGGEESLFFVNSIIYLDGDTLIVDGKSYPYEMVMPMEPDIWLLSITDRYTDPTSIEELEERFGGPINRNTMNDAVILPIEDVYVPTSPVPGFEPNLLNNLLLRYRDGELHGDLAAQVVQELNHKYSDRQFTVDNRYLELKGRMEDYSYDMDRWLLVAVSILFLSGVGCIGSMYLLLDKRRHFMAVSIAYGSTLKRIMAETVAELLTVLFAGGILGILILPLLQKITVYQDKLRVNMAGIGIVSIMAIAFSLVSVSLGMHAVRIKDVAAALKEE